MLFKWDAQRERDRQRAGDNETFMHSCSSVIWKNHVGFTNQTIRQKMKWKLITCRSKLQTWKYRLMKVLITRILDTSKRTGKLLNSNSKIIKYRINNRQNPYTIFSRSSDVRFIQSVNIEILTEKKQRDTTIQSTNRHAQAIIEKIIQVESDHENDVQSFTLSVCHFPWIKSGWKTRWKIERISLPISSWICRIPYLSPLRGQTSLTDDECRPDWKINRNCLLSILIFSQNSKRMHRSKYMTESPLTIQNNA